VLQCVEELNMKNGRLVFSTHTKSRIHKKGNVMKNMNITIPHVQVPKR